MNRPSTLDQQGDLRVQSPPAAPPPSAAPKSRWWLWLIVLVLLGLGVYYFYFRPKGGSSNASAATSGAAGAKARGPMTTPVVAAKARKGDIGVYITGLGAVTPIYTVAVTSRVQGQVMKVAYNEGQDVNQGDTLVEVDPRPY